jgi:hypothetical protein
MESRVRGRKKSESIFLIALENEFRVSSSRHLYQFPSSTFDKQHIMSSTSF